jgi:PIF1-like helicase/Helix-turn-helix domain/HRDC domain
MNPFSENPQLTLVYNFIETTGNNIFLTGKAGTGKTTFLKELQKISPKRMIVVAPTGVAAINAGGVTIHSFFQMPFGPQLPLRNKTDLSDEMISEPVEQTTASRMNREKRNIIRSLDLLIIDEISMVRADLLDGVDSVLRRFRNRNKPFGGVQLLMIGDLQQLAPVVKEDEWAILKKYYETAFFFSSKALQEAGFLSIELKHIYRQTDQLFISLLNKVRDNKLDSDALELLNKRYIANFKAEDKEGFITLTTHNAQAQLINESKLKMLKGREYIFNAIIEGEFPEYSYPTEKRLLLKIGAQVMFIKNDSSFEKLYFNGKIGRIDSIEDRIIYISCEGDDSLILVENVEWQNMKYSINESTKEIEETPVGTFKQLPLKLAWAITIHKSQGLTFDKAIIDAKAAFAHGQVYVALSRCRTLEGLVLSSPITNNGVITSSAISKFSHEIEENIPGDIQLLNSKIKYQKALINELFDFSILLRRINYCLKICREHAASFLGNPVQNFEILGKAMRSELMEVAVKFLLQVEKISVENTAPEENSLLQERIKKASVYFYDKIEERAVPVIKKINIDTDNKTVKKSISTAFEMLQLEIIIKSESLKESILGFSTKKYLETRSKASIEQAERKKKIKIETNLNSADVAYPEVFTELKAWRSKNAKSKNLPDYMILSQKAIASLSQFLPASLSDLKTIKGIGKSTIEKYGEEILKIILQYREKHDINLKMPEPEIQPGLRKKVEKNTKELSFKMFQNGKSIAEIASERKLAVTTIEGHLSFFVGKGEIDINKLVPEEKVVRISNYFMNSDTTNLNPAKAALGDEISYSELRYVLKHLQFSGKIS